MPAIGCVSLSSLPCTWLQITCKIPMSQAMQQCKRSYLLWHAIDIWIPFQRSISRRCSGVRKEANSTHEEIVLNRNLSPQSSKPSQQLKMWFTLHSTWSIRECGSPMFAPSRKTHLRSSASMAPPAQARVPRVTWSMCGRVIVWSPKRHQKNHVQHHGRPTFRPSRVTPGRYSAGNLPKHFQVSPFGLRKAKARQSSMQVFFPGQRSCGCSQRVKGRCWKILTHVVA